MINFQSSKKADSIFFASILTALQQKEFLEVLTLPILLTSCVWIFAQSLYLLIAIKPIFQFLKISVFTSVISFISSEIT